MTVRYTFVGNTTLVQTTIKARQQLYGFSMAGTQAGPLNYLNARLLQRVKNGDRLSAWTDITEAPAAVRVHTANMQSSQKVAWNSYKFGQTIGITSATINGRKVSTANVVDLSAARKQYPIAIEGVTLKPGDVVKVSAYRHYWPGDEPPTQY
jgi:hypothetical protein